jgi:UDP-N-acetylglucosamine 4-epimerase
MSLDPGESPVLVTGGAGFIGSHLCESLIAKGRAVRCLDNLATGQRGNVALLEGRPGFEFIPADIRDARSLAQAMNGASAVVHLAALGSVPRSIALPADAESNNLGGFLQVLEAARSTGIRRVVYASSSSVYGDSPAMPKREGEEGHALSPYAVTKAMDEAYAGLYHRLFGLETIGLRFFNIFGERQDPEGPYAAAIPRFIRALLRHETPLIHGDGLQTRDFTYVLNAVQAVEEALLAPARIAGDVFNIAVGQSCSLLHLVRKMQARLAVIDPDIARVPVAHGPVRPGDVRHSLADISKARALLGFVPQFGLDEGLDRAVPWYAQHWQ